MHQVLNFSLKQNISVETSAARDFFKSFACTISRYRLNAFLR